MKKKTVNLFPYYLTHFFTIYLLNQRNVSINTIKSYRDTFKIMFMFCKEKKNIEICNITFNIISKEFVMEFLDYLENTKNNSISTRNQRLAAIHAFCRFVQMEEPMHMDNLQKILDISFKKTTQNVVDYLSPEAIKILLEQPDITTLKGFRDLVIMSLLYDTGARVQELIDIKIKDVKIDSTSTIILHGKGNKIRKVPIMNNTKKLLNEYLKSSNKNPEENLFESRCNKKFSRKGICYIINKYAEQAHQQSPAVPKNIHPHMFRHTKAMHLLQSGVNLIYIRDFLGHVDIQTTEIYAKYDTETKRKAIENAYPDLIQSKIPNWKEDSDLLKWLNTL